MKVFHRYHNLPAAVQNSVLAIGNFDGIHKGHQQVLKTARELAAATKAPFNVLTFEPHPTSVFNRSAKPFRLTPIRSKVRALANEGVDNLIIMHFVSDFYNLSPQDFIKQVLVEGLKVSAVVVGKNYRFGKDREGTIHLLQKAGKKYGFKVEIVPPVLNKEKKPFSSSLARFYLSRGQMDKVNQLLGRPWEAEARVVQGAKLGRTMGFPTANLNFGGAAEPCLGVYVAKVGVPEDDGTFKWYSSVMNYGLRPTVDGTKLVLEAHLLDFNGDLYGKRIRVRPVRYLRPELKLKSTKDLKKMISEDIIWASIILAQDEEHSEFIIRGEKRK